MSALVWSISSWFVLSQSLWISQKCDTKRRIFLSVKQQNVQHQNLRTTQTDSSALCLKLGAWWKLRWIFCTLPLPWVINKRESILSLLLLVLGKNSLANFWVFFETDGSVASPINYLAAGGAGDFKRHLSISCWCSCWFPRQPISSKATNTPTYEMFNYESPCLIKHPKCCT